jgi:hypothetical protein
MFSGGVQLRSLAHRSSRHRSFCLWAIAAIASSTAGHHHGHPLLTPGFRRGVNKSAIIVNFLINLSKALLMPSGVLSATIMRVSLCSAFIPIIFFYIIV